MTEYPDKVGKLSVGPKLSEQAYLALRSAIVAGEFPPGQRLTERSLADRLGVSPTPVREALQRLEHEQLIVRDIARSIRVADPSIVRLQELTVVEAALRGVAARLAAAAASEAEKDEIATMCDRAEALESEPDLQLHPGDLLSLTRRFHTLVDTASHNASLVNMIATATAFDWAFRLKWASRVHRDAASLDHSLCQHRAVADAIRAGDGDLAEHTMREHILQRGQAFLEIAATPTSP